MVILSLKTVQYQNNEKCYEFIEIKNVILIEKLFRCIQWSREIYFFNCKDKTNGNAIIKSYRYTISK
jgi:hypothetical protein